MRKEDLSIITAAEIDNIPHYDVIEAREMSGKTVKKLATASLVAGMTLSSCTPTFVKPFIETPSSGEAIAVGLLDSKAINDLPAGEVKNSFLAELNSVKEDCAEITGCMGDTVQIYRVITNDNVYSYRFANVIDEEGLRTQVLSVMNGKTKEETQINEDLVSVKTEIDGVPTKVFGYVDDLGNSHYILEEKQTSEGQEFIIFDAQGNPYEVIAQNEKEVQAYSHLWQEPSIVQAESLPIAEKTPTEIQSTEIAVDQIKLDENSFIPTGEYPKNGDNLVLLEGENVGDAAKAVVLENGLGEQAQAIEDMYQAILDKHRLYSVRIPQGATLSFTYLVYSKEGVGNWSIIAQLNGFGVPRVMDAVLYDKSMVKNQYLSQSEILNIAISRAYPKNIWPKDAAMPVGFGKEIKPSYYTDENGNFVVGIADKNSIKPFVWYDSEREFWRMGISENEINENTQLQENMDSWMKGSVVISDEEKFKSGQDIAPLSLVNSSEGASIYQGVFLGTEVYSGNLIAYFGFEDGNNKHFFMPISLGSVYSDTAFLAITRPTLKDIGRGSNYDVESLYSVNGVDKVFNNFGMKTIGIFNVERLLERECLYETDIDLKNLCNEQMMISEGVLDIFNSITARGSSGVNSPLVNGIAGKNGLDLSDIPLINAFRILPKSD